MRRGKAREKNAHDKPPPADAPAMVARAAGLGYKRRDHQQRRDGGCPPISISS